MSVAQAWPMSRGLRVGHAWARPAPGLPVAKFLHCSLSKAEKGFILCWLENNNNYIKNSPLSQKCLFLIDINKIGIIVKRRFFSFNTRSAIILTPGYHIFLLITKMIISILSIVPFSRLIFVLSRNSRVSRNLCYPTCIYLL